jgi:radical SAM-linked protein
VSHPASDNLNSAVVQRMRVAFATDDSVKYVGHLDMHRAWERAIRRAGLPLAYSQGFNPQPRIQFAAALPVGFTGLAELVDVFLYREMDSAEFLNRLVPALPGGIRPTAAWPVARKDPSLQSQVCGARYRVEVESTEAPQVFEARLAAFLACPEAWRERRRGKEVTRYDLRPLVQSLEYRGPGDQGGTFEVTMRAEAGATGRPDELLAELGFEAAPRRIMRLSLQFHEARTRSDLPQSLEEANTCGY